MLKIVLVILILAIAQNSQASSSTRTVSAEFIQVCYKMVPISSSFAKMRDGGIGVYDVKRMLRRKGYGESLDATVNTVYASNLSPEQIEAVGMESCGKLKPEQSRSSSIHETADDVTNLFLYKLGRITPFLLILFIIGFSIFLIRFIQNRRTR